MINKRTIRLGWITLALVLTIALAGVVPAKESKPLTAGTAGRWLDGLAFVGETGRAGKDSGKSDEFQFAGGRFQASSFAAYGFSDAEYASNEVDGELRFTVDVVSNRSGGGKMKWTGILRGDVLEGTMRWDHGWESKRYWFRGRTTSETAAIR